MDKFQDVIFNTYIDFGKFVKDYDYLNINPKILSISDIIDYSTQHSQEYQGVVAAYFGNMNESIKVGHVKEMICLG